MSVLIVDYGMCNLGSVKRALEECGADAFISDDPKDANQVSHIVLPGVGAFADAIQNIKAKGWDSAIKKNVLEEGVPLFGICLGMQLLADRGYEGGEHAGLGLIPGEVVKLYTNDPSVQFRVPHIGWNEIAKKSDNSILLKTETGTDFYFVHSYFFNAASNDHVLATTNYGLDFPSIVGKDKIFGVQFHPEKSSRAGFQLLKNFLEVN